MSHSLIAPCGLDCAGCGAYLATQANDRAAQEAVMVQWRVQYNAPNLTLEDVTCDGCRAASGRHGGHCAKCEIRACAVARNLGTCAECDAYACDKLQAFFGFVPAAKENLDRLRR